MLEKSLIYSYTPNVVNILIVLHNCSVIPHEQKKKKSPTSRHIEVQTSDPGLKYQWSTQNLGYPIEGYPYGLGFVDPTPIATHVISPDALECKFYTKNSMMTGIQLT